MDDFKIPRLISGGIITNYYCTSRCRHCLYNSGPNWPKKYISYENARAIFSLCFKLGAYQMHIGGGEPFLNRSGLLAVAKAAKDIGVLVEYVETNCSWFTSVERACRILNNLMELGVQTLLISISPFHLEYINFGRVRGVIEACKKVGMGIFPWTSKYLNDFAKLDPLRTYPLEELDEIFGPGYVRSIPNNYWLHPGGRCIEYYFNGQMQVEELLRNNSNGCRELLDTSHFHMDLYGNYVPGLCAGIAMALEDLSKPISKEKYPIIFTLLKEGINGLYNFALKKGFSPDPFKRYGHKCQLCNELRRFLVQKIPESKELAPKEYYIY